MKLYLINTAYGLIPSDDETYDTKQHLTIGQEYLAEIKLVRNPRFHRLYFSLINKSWELLPERQTNGFRSIENWRNYLTVAAGYCETFYSPTRREWIEIPKSIAFDKMDEAEFHDLYEATKNVIWNILSHCGIKEETFINALISY